MYSINEDAKIKNIEKMQKRQMQRLDLATEYLNNTKDLEIEQLYLNAQIESRKTSIPNKDI